MGETHREKTSDSAAIVSAFGSPSADECAEIARLVATLTSPEILITSEFEEERSAARALSLTRCAIDPPMIAVATRKGHTIEPLIRDSRAFCAHILKEADRLLARKFPVEIDTAPASNANPAASTDEHIDDPFDALPLCTIRTGAPVIKRAAVAFDCEVVRHFDLEADHGMYIGLVVGVRAFAEVPKPNPNGQTSQPTTDAAPDRSSPSSSDQTPSP